jgi:transcriptional regulator with PAS, ATPase and Fis domain
MHNDIAAFDTNVTSNVTPFRPTLRPTSRGKIVGRSPELVDIISTIDRVARARCNVLVTGESGTGKEVFVAAIHDASPRANGPLVTVNCGALPENLMESELFGHARGAFTGAHVTRQGRVAQAEGGTLFLDEIGELPLPLQAKLLRLLQQREYTPVGDNRTLKSDVRIIAATNRDLAAEVQKGTFREDLYYRLNVIHIHLPPLAQRGSDVEVLANHFFNHAREVTCRDDLTGLAPDAIEALAAHNWPGNVRELENVIMRAVLLAPGPEVRARDLPRMAGCEAPKSAVIPKNLPIDGVDLRSMVESYESGLIQQALDKTGWNKNRAAKLLGINRTTLVEMVKRKGLAPAA